MIRIAFPTLALFVLVTNCRLPLHAQDAVSIGGYTLDEDAATQWRLHRRLREISGLAVSPDDRLFAHDDERAIIYEIDYREGKRKLVKAFALGDETRRDETQRGDFEGIAIVGERFYLVSSYGHLYESFEGEDGDHKLFNSYGTGAGRRCEVEGLTYEPSDGTLLLLCKVARDKALKDFVTIYRWSVERRALASDSLIQMPLRSFTRHIGGKSFSPSGIDRHPTSGNYFIVAAREGAIAEVTKDGQVLAVVEFPKGMHRQAEGIAFTSDGTLFIADEGRGKRARLSMYRP